MTTKKHPAPTTIDPMKLGAVISEIIDEIEPRHPRFHPMKPRITDRKARVSAYIDLMKRVGIRYRRCSFDSYKIYEEHAHQRPSQQQVFESLFACARQLPRHLQDGGGVVLYGRPGTGKDHLLLALAYSAILQWGFEVQWVDGAELYQAARRLIETKESESAFLLRFTRKQILIISDPVPPNGPTSQHGVGILHRILDRRYRDCLSIWVTLNVHDGREAEERLATAVTSRLRHNSLVHLCDWEDYRRAYKMEAKDQTTEAK